MRYCSSPRVIAAGAIALLLLLPMAASGKTALSHERFSYAARIRMRNRAVLLIQYRARQQKLARTVTVGDEASKKALRRQNRRLIKQHPEWFPGPLKAGDSRWRALADNASFLSSDHLSNMTDVAIHRLERQLGKPYVWGGDSPDNGFDCSGLVFYAYNKILTAKLPRTANEMYHYRRAIPVSDGELRRGDLLFFHIHSRDSADHMGVYLGKDRFIESPRSGETIRISRLSDDFWRQHYLGARRILSPETVL